MAAERPLPPEVQRLCDALAAPDRLVRHLRLVHDAAVRLCEGLRAHFPELTFDAPLVCFGAATHDLGKARHPEELSAPGRQHEIEGPTLLASLGVSSERARFTRTHAAWDAEGTALEDRLVAWADKLWKGHRPENLEMHLAAEIAGHLDAETWAVYAVLDEIASPIAEGGPAALMG